MFFKKAQASSIYQPETQNHHHQLHKAKRRRRHYTKKKSSGKVVDHLNLNINHDTDLLDTQQRTRYNVPVK